MKRIIYLKRHSQTGNVQIWFNETQSQILDHTKDRLQIKAIVDQLGQTDNGNFCGNFKIHLTYLVEYVEMPQAKPTEDQYKKAVLIYWGKPTGTTEAQTNAAKAVMSGYCNKYSIHTSLLEIIDNCKQPSVNW